MNPAVDDLMMGLTPSNKRGGIHFHYLQEAFFCDFKYTLQAQGLDSPMKAIKDMFLLEFLK